MCTFSYNGSAWSPATQPFFNAGTTSATVHAYYGKSGGSSGTQVNNSTESFSVATDQSGDANYKASDLMYATATVQKTSPTASLTFAHRMSKILVTANIGAGVTNIQSVKIVGGYRTINISTPQSCTLGTSLSDANSSTNITMWSGTSTSPVNCAALIPPQTIDGNFLQIVTDKGTATYSLSSKQFETGKSYTFNITVNAAAIGTTVAITGWTGTNGVTVNPTTTIVQKTPVGLTAVDLGLSVKWANMNVGAEAETDYGTYFAWGETAGMTVSGASSTVVGSPAKTTYDWANYDLGTSTSNLYMYNSTDNLTTLKMSDDAARANWGGNWRMPTEEDFDELVNTENCSWTWESSPVAGYRVTSKKSGYTSNSIFLPAAGYRGNSGFISQGSSGYYWSSSLPSDNPMVAVYLIFNSSNASMNVRPRSSGCTVRAVQTN